MIERVCTSIEFELWTVDTIKQMWYFIGMEFYCLRDRHIIMTHGSLCVQRSSSACILYLPSSITLALEISGSIFLMITISNKAQVRYSDASIWSSVGLGTRYYTSYITVTVQVPALRPSEITNNNNEWAMLWVILTCFSKMIYWLC